MMINKFSAKVLKVVGLVWQGYTSVAEIGLLANMNSKSVLQVLESGDTSVRELLRNGIESDTAILDIPIKCRWCNSMIYRVPCVLCRCKGVHHG